MHIPDHFRMEADEASLLLNSGAADVVAYGPNGLEASFLPLFYQSGPDYSSLTTHIGKINPLAQLDGAPGMAIFNGVDAFIKSQWIRNQDHTSDGASWNYLTLQAHGTLQIHTDDQWMTQQVLAHQLALEPDFDTSSLPPEHLTKMLRAMAGLELVIHHVEAKAKMSQNKSVTQIVQIISGLREVGCTQVANWMEAFSLPRAQEKERNLAEIKERHAAK